MDGYIKNGIRIWWREEGTIDLSLQRQVENDIKELFSTGMDICFPPLMIGYSS